MQLPFFSDQNLHTGTPHTAAHHIPIPNLARGLEHHAHTLAHYPDLDPARVRDPALSLVHHTPAEAEVGVVVIDPGHAVQHIIAHAADLHHIEVGNWLGLVVQCSVLVPARHRLETTVPARSSHLLLKWRVNANTTAGTESFLLMTLKLIMDETLIKMIPMSESATESGKESIGSGMINTSRATTTHQAVSFEAVVQAVDLLIRLSGFPLPVQEKTHPTAGDDGRITHHHLKATVALREEVVQ